MTMPLAEVVVCAVGRGVTLPLMEMTAQSTALPALVTFSAGMEPENSRGNGKQRGFVT